MPRGRRPSIAAFTRSGARNASEIVLLIFRGLQRSVLAMLSVVTFGSAIISSSQRRPRGAGLGPDGLRINGQQSFVGGQQDIAASAGRRLTQLKLSVSTSPS